MNKFKYSSSPYIIVEQIVLLLIVCLLCCSIAIAQYEEPTELNVKGAVHEDPIYRLPVAGNIISSKTTAESGYSNLENVMGSIPGLSFAGGSSRPRFFQIRGIGELEQYEGAPNPSVGFFLDDLDLSGLGIGASFFDLSSVEVLKGPQATRYGASALAGAVRINSKEPTVTHETISSLGLGSDGFRSLGAATGGPVPGAEEFKFRISVAREEQNGFIHNNFYNSDSTNARNETTSRGKILFQPNARLKIETAATFIDVDNGYDAFSINNGFKTESDRPGTDGLEVLGGSVKTGYRFDSLILRSTSTALQASQDYSFDGDWGNDLFWGVNAPYDYFSTTDRTRRTLSQELRLASKDSDYVHGQNSRWLAGAFVQKLHEGTLTNQEFSRAVYDRLDSDYVAKTAALFAEYELPLGTGSSLSAALRSEARKSNYDDSRGNKLSPDDQMLGGQISLSKDINENILAYSTLSRGFKGGGINAGVNIPNDRKQFNPEYLWNLETGLKGSLFERTLKGQVSGFVGKREKAQLKLAIQTNPNDPLSFTYLTDNAAQATFFGLDAELAWQASDRLSLHGTLAALDSKIENVAPELEYLSGREQASSPHLQYSTGIRFGLSQNIFTRADVIGSQAFYFDESHNQRSAPYSLLNLSLGYQSENFTFTLWARNAFNKRHAVRGFYFGNEPPDFPNKLYVQWGEPLMVGANLSVTF